MRKTARPYTELNPGTIRFVREESKFTDHHETEKPTLAELVKLGEAPAEATSNGSYWALEVVTDYDYYQSYHTDVEPEFEMDPQEVFSSNQVVVWARDAFSWENRDACPDFECKWIPVRCQDDLLELVNLMDNQSWSEEEKIMAEYTHEDTISQINEEREEAIMFWKNSPEYQALTDAWDEEMAALDRKWDVTEITYRSQLPNEYWDAFQEINRKHQDGIYAAQDKVTAAFPYPDPPGQQGFEFFIEEPALDTEYVSSFGDMLKEVL